MRETVAYRGRTYQRYPGAKNWSDANYFKDHGRLLHIEIYKAEVGPIPPGHHIHHKDGNSLNNDPANLEAISPEEHRRLHPPKPRPIADATRQAAAAWHRSPEGREWHREHGKRAWAKRTPQTYTCERCGKKFESLRRGKVRSCSNACRQALTRASAAAKRRSSSPEC